VKWLQYSTSWLSKEGYCSPNPHFTGFKLLTMSKSLLHVDQMTNCSQSMVEVCFVLWWWWWWWWCLCDQRGELASERAKDAVMRSLIEDSMSLHRQLHNVSDMSTESRLQTMQSEISSAAAQHRDLVKELNSPSHASDASDRPGDNYSTDTHSSDTRSPSISSSADWTTKYTVARPMWVHVGRDL